ncbi:MAG: cell envelope integrity protein TolA [Bdellovibrionales bacterium]|nr:cell envelope integrity protein TolA [Massilia sp.]
MNPAAGGVPYRVPREPNPGSSILMAVVVHVALLMFLYVGVSWQNTAPTSVEAEVWDMKTESAAAPPEPTPPPVQRPEPVPEPKGEPKVIPKITPPPPKVVEQPVAPKAPDIALERQKEKKKLLEKKLADEKIEKQKELKKEQELADQKAQDLAEKKAEKKAEQLAEKKAQEQADKKAQELADKKAQEKADKLAKAKTEAAEQKKSDALRDKEMKRIAGALGTVGSAEKSTAPRIDSGYVAAVTSKIKRSTSYNGDTDVSGNPKAVFKIEQLPTGEIISVRKIKSSGIAAFDDAVERGINNSSPLPKKKDGTVERSIEVSILMKELN